MLRTCDRRIGRYWRTSLFLAGLLAGCSAGPGPVTGPIKAPWLPPVQPPPGFDRQRASLALSQIPDDPPGPPAKTTGAGDLPRAIIDQLAEAGRLLQKGQPAEAISLLETTLAVKADCQEAHRLIAVACLLTGNDERAGLSAGRALELCPDDLVACYVVGRLAEKQRDTAKAIRAYRTALKCKASTEHAEYPILVHYRLGLLLDQERYYLAAAEQLALFEKGVRSLGARVHEKTELASVVRLQRGPAALRMARARSYLGDYDAAADAMQVAVAESAKDLELRADYVRMLAHAGRLDRALAESRALVMDSRGGREAVELLLGVHLAAGQPDAGVAVMRELAAQQPDNVELRLLYSDALVEAGRYEQAASELKDLVARFPKAADAGWKLVSIQRFRQDWSGWLLALAQMLANEPGEYDRAGRELDQAPAEIARRIMDEAHSGGEAGRLIPADPSDPTVSAALSYLFGRLCDRMDQVERAREWFDRAGQRRPDFLPAIVGVAELYTARCRWNDAIAVLEKLAASGQPSHLVERLLGQCFDGLDDVPKAVKHYQAAITIDSEDVPTIMLLARLLERLDKVREAQQQYQTLVTVAPDYMPGRENYIRSLMSSSGGFTSAVVAGRLALEFAEMQRRAPRDPATVRVAALLRFLQDRDRQAYCDVLRSLIQAHPGDERSREDLAATLLTFRDYEPARQVLADMVGRFPRSGQAGLMMAMTLARLLEFDGAASEFERILLLHPNREVYLEGLAELRMTQQRFEAAIPLYERLIRLQGEAEFPSAYSGRLMEAYRRAGRLDEARTLAEKWLAEIDPKNKAAAAMRAVGRWFLLAADEVAKDYEAYLRRCRTWLDEDPKDPVTRSWLIGLATEAPAGASGRFGGYGGLVGAERCSEAVTQVMAWVSETPRDNRLLRSLADVLIACGRFDEAIELQRTLTAAASKNDEKLVLLYGLQGTLTRARRYDEAIAVAREWMDIAQRFSAGGQGTSRQELDGAVFEQRRAVGMLLSQQGRTDEAVTHLSGMLKQEEDDSRKIELLRGLAYVFQRQGRLAMAEEHLRQAYELMPSDIGLNNDLGYTLADAGTDLVNAERMLRMAVGESPRQAPYLDSLGWVFYKQGRFEEARRWLELAAGQHEGQDAVIHDHLGDALWQVGQKEKAADRWRESLRLYERQFADGTTEPNEKLVPSLKAKLAAIDHGRVPPVAPVGQATTSAASEP